MDGEQGCSPDCSGNEGQWERGKRKQGTEFPKGELNFSKLPCFRLFSGVEDLVEFSNIVILFKKEKRCLFFYPRNIFGVWAMFFF